MLTLILLVVLGGGAGLMAVWLIDARGLSDLVDRSGWRSLRRTPSADTARPGAPSAAEDEPTPVPATAAPAPRAAPERTQELPPPVPATTSSTTPSETSTVAYVPVEAPLQPLPTRSPRRDGKRVPAAYTAVEGSYRDVARPPLWRRALSLVWLLCILLVVAVTIAALAGATIGLIAELVDGAIG